MRSRRHFLQAMLAGFWFSPALQARSGRALNFGLTPVILDDRRRFLRQWGEWMGDSLDHDIHFMQRARYSEIMDLLLSRQLDLAWVCGYPYVREKKRTRLLAVPVYNGKPLYHSLIITGTENRDVRRFGDLENHVFAFSDPDSNSGYLYPRYRIQQQYRRTPETFFSRSFFTWSHRNTVEAVASGLAQGGAVDSYVWEQLHRLQPELVEKTRIVERSPAFGFPPLVTHNAIDPGLFERLQNFFIRMNRSAPGSRVLASLGLDGFQAGSPELFASIEAMAEVI